MADDELPVIVSLRKTDATAAHYRRKQTEHECSTCGETVILSPEGQAFAQANEHLIVCTVCMKVDSLDDLKKIAPDMRLGEIPGALAAVEQHHGSRVADEMRSIIAMGAKGD